jgi:hypothetical protein
MSLDKVVQRFSNHFKRHPKTYAILAGFFLFFVFHEKITTIASYLFYLIVGVYYRTQDILGTRLADQTLANFLELFFYFIMAAGICIAVISIFNSFADEDDE